MPARARRPAHSRTERLRAMKSNARFERGGFIENRPSVRNRFGTFRDKECSRIWTLRWTASDRMRCIVKRARARQQHSKRDHPKRHGVRFSYAGCDGGFGAAEILFRISSIARWLRIPAASAVIHSRTTRAQSLLRSPATPNSTHRLYRIRCAWKWQDPNFCTLHHIRDREHLALQQRRPVQHHPVRLERRLRCDDHQVSAAVGCRVYPSYLVRNLE